VLVFVAHQRAERDHAIDLIAIAKLLVTSIFKYLVIMHNVVLYESKLLHGYPIFDWDAVCLW